MRAKFTTVYNIKHSFHVNFENTHNNTDWVAVLFQLGAAEFYLFADMQQVAS